jgi:hypothetical protein
MTFPELLARWQQCHTLEHKRAFLTCITRPEREPPVLDARGTGTKRDAACEPPPEIEALREAP